MDSFGVMWDDDGGEVKVGKDKGNWDIYEVVKKEQVK